MEMNLHSLLPMRKNNRSGYSIILLILLLAASASPGIYAERSDELIIAKPFGPSIKGPDPALGSNGWYTGEAGVTETLFMLDLEMNLKPWLAEEYKNISPLIWEIKLKEGMLFHDKTPVNAAAVKWCLERIIDKESSTFNIRTQQMLDIKTITIKDSRTLIFETSKPNAAFLYYLTSPGTAIISPGSGRKNIYATGPFLLEEVIPKEKMNVSRFDDYWGSRAKLSKVQLNIISNPATRMLAFEAGQLDIATNFPENDVKRLSSRKDIQIYSKPTNRLCFLFARVADGPLKDLKVRMALNYAINRQELIDTVLAGVGGQIGASIFPEILPWCNRDLHPYPYDPDMAKSLLTEAGALDSNKDGILEIEGKPLVLNMWTYEGRASLKPILELIQAQLNRVGIQTNLKVTKTGSPINQAMKRGNVNLNLQMWNSAPEGDPDYFISNVFKSGAGSNFMEFRNQELDELTEKGKITFDPAERKIIYNRIQEIIYNESPVIVLFNKTMISAVYNHVGGFRIHPAEKYLLTPDLYRK